MTDSSWRRMFELQGRGVGRPPTGAPPPGRSPEPSFEEEASPVDLSDYSPWTIQRGRSRPAMMLQLRRLEPKSGLWTGWGLSYPHLVALEYTGDRLLSLDFGSRQFMIEGRGLDELARHIQQGVVLSVQEYAPSIWPGRPEGQFITSIRQLGDPARSP